MANVNWGKRVCALIWLCVAVRAQTFTTLANFDRTNEIIGSTPPLVQGPDGNLYGTSPRGEVNGRGSIFKVTPGGTLTTLYGFGTASTDSSNPQGPLVPGAPTETCTAPPAGARSANQARSSKSPQQAP
jgi:uncharacterized repeat protein (TIGR03803 family)